MPWLSVNQRRALVLYAVPMPSFALDVQRGSPPGAPGAFRASGFKWDLLGLACFFQPPWLKAA
jgi:hypothetical protein